MIKGLPLTLILTGIIIAFYIMDFYFMSQHDRLRKTEGKGWSWDYTLFTLALAALILLQPVIFPIIGWSTDAPWGLIIQFAGFLSVALSFGLHIWSRRHLRHFYTERVEVQPDHNVIDTGPYALMRHPIITSFFLIAGGVLLVNPAFTTLLVFGYTLWSFAGSAKEEEKVLSEKVRGYAEYMKRTPRFVPSIWKK